MIAFVEEKTIHPEIDRVFNFANAESAFELMKEGNQFGKIVLKP